MLVVLKVVVSYFDDGFVMWNLFGVEFLFGGVLGKLFVLLESYLDLKVNIIMI